MGNIVNVDIKGASAFRVVMAPPDGDGRGDLVLELSNQGWRVVQSFERTVEEFVLTRDELGNKRANGQRQTIVQVGFLMAYFPDDPVADLQKQLAEAKELLLRRVTEIAAAKYALSEAVSAADATKRTLEERLACSEASLATSRKDVEVYTKSRQRFEEDLGKIRRAIGDMRMKEILGT